MPRVDVAWSDVWIGAVVTALLFTVGKFVIGVYIGKSGVTSGFGAAGSLVVLLVWVYYSAQVFLMGAEFTWAYAVTFGSRKEEPVPTAAPAIPSATAKKQPEQHLLEAKQAAVEEDIIKKEEGKRPDA
jgi:membrane protein